MDPQETQLTLAQLRTLLAAERTFAAWVRTALAGIGGGLAIDKLLVFEQTSHEWIARLAGQVLIVGGAALILFAFWDYRRAAQIAGRTDQPRARLWVFALISAALIGVALLLFWLTL
jgi:putative membrane protein